LKQSPFSEEILQKSPDLHKNQSSNESFHSKKAFFEAKLRKLKKILDKSPEKIIFQRNFSDFLYFELALTQISRVFRGLKLKRLILAWNRLVQGEIQWKIWKNHENQQKIEKIEKTREIRTFYEWKNMGNLKKNGLKIMAFIMENHRKKRLFESFSAIYKKKLCILLRKKVISRVFNRKNERFLMFSTFERIRTYKSREAIGEKGFLLLFRLFNRKKHILFEKIRIFNERNIEFKRKINNFEKITGNYEKNLKKNAFLRLFIWNYRILQAKINEKKLKKAAFLLKKAVLLRKKQISCLKARVFHEIIAFSNKKEGFHGLFFSLEKLEIERKSHIFEKIKLFALFLREKSKKEQEINAFKAKNYIIQGYSLFIIMSKTLQKLEFLNKSSFFDILKEKTLKIRDINRENEQRRLFGLLKIIAFFKKKALMINLQPFFMKIQEKAQKKPIYIEKAYNFDENREFNEKKAKNKEISDVFAEKLLQIKRKFALLERNKENSRDHNQENSFSNEIPKELPFLLKELKPHFLKDDPLKTPNKFI